MRSALRILVISESSCSCVGSGGSRQCWYFGACSLVRCGRGRMSSTAPLASSAAGTSPAVRSCVIRSCIVIVEIATVGASLRSEMPER